MFSAEVAGDNCDLRLGGAGSPAEPCLVLGASEYEAHAVTSPPGQTGVCPGTDVTVAN